MGLQSIVHGYIVERDGIYHSANQSFNFDERHPFTNIFFTESPQQYFFAVIGFVGSSNQIEERWNEWLWKFGQLLSTLEAWEAHVYLDCVRGSFYWRLLPQSRALEEALRGQDMKMGGLPLSFKGEEWGIVEAPVNDFTLSPWPGDNISPTWSESKKTWEQTQWTKQIPRWTKNEL